MSSVVSRERIDRNIEVDGCISIMRNCRGHFDEEKGNKVTKNLNRSVANLVREMVTKKITLKRRLFNALNKIAPNSSTQYQLDQ